MGSSSCPPSSLSRPGTAVRSQGGGQANSSQSIHAVYHTHRWVVCNMRGESNLTDPTTLLLWHQHRSAAAQDCLPVR